MLAALRASFAFLTILIPGRMFSNACIKKSTFFYPVVGIVLGIILSYSSVLVLKLSGSSPLASVAYLILAFFFTRGLHHDGLADIADAWGSSARGTKFREILKDSRIGSFGTIILILYFLLCYTAITSILSAKLAHDFIKYPIQNIFSIPNIYADAIFLLFLAPIWGRIGFLAQPAFDMPYSASVQKEEKISDNYIKKNNNLEEKITISNSQFNDNNNNNNSSILPLASLSQNMVHPFQKARFFLWFFIYILIFLFFASPIRLIFILGLSFIIFLGFYFLSKREHGYNGDFLGAQCLCYESLVFLSVYI